MAGSSLNVEAQPGGGISWLERKNEQDRQLRVLKDQLVELVELSRNGSWGVECLKCKPLWGATSDIRDKEEIEEVKEELGAKKREFVKLQGQLKGSGKAVKALVEELQSQDNGIFRFKAREEKLKQQIKTLEAEKKELERNMEGEEARGMKAELEEKDEVIEGLRAELESKDRAIFRLEARVGSLEIEIERIKEEGEAKRLREELDQKVGVIDRLNRRMKRMEMELERVAGILQKRRDLDENIAAMAEAYAREVRDL